MQTCHSLVTGLLMAALANMAAITPAQAAAGTCAQEAGVLACQDLGTFSVSATRVQVTRTAGKNKHHPDAQVVRTYLRVRNGGAEPLILVHRLGTSRLVDNRGQVHGHDNNEARRAGGIGLLRKGQADTQFQLAPGQAREFWLEGDLRYNPGKTQPGNEFTHDFTLVEMRKTDGPLVDLVRDHSVALTGLRDTGAPARALVQQLLGK